jgi:hypothetical protein
MTRLEDRQILVRDIEQACADGARLALACALAGIDARTLRRWKVSMAARNSPESSGRNSPLHSDSVTAKPSRRSDIGKAVEIEIDDLLKRLGGGAVAHAFGQGVGPGGILGL